MLGQWPISMRAIRQAICRVRPMMWARGRKRRVAAVWPVTSWKTGCSSSTVLAASACRLAWVRTQPLGRPVVPEV
jgi:hypothetical protein